MPVKSSAKVKHVMFTYNKNVGFLKKKKKGKKPVHKIEEVKDLKDIIF